ncbi:MAG TPA: transglycosylase SLT domain-containing protein [Xanthomonadaceae bacterium]|nr:transglycosylase SLT domain-containing protein [Xanthomonadaceae bacterium]
MAQRRPRVTADSLAQTMATSEQRYRAALIKIANNDPDGAREANSALGEMDATVTTCTRTRGCQVGSLLAVYRRLLGLNAEAEALPLSEDRGDPLDAEPDHSPIAASVPQAARAASLLSEDGHRFDTMVQYNPAVQAGIRRWLTDLRGPLLASHENYQYMRHLMWPQYQRAGLPEALLFGIMAKESNGRVHATSRSGAGGPLQFMPATGRRFGLGPDGTGFDTRYDPRASAEASVAYLNERMGQLNRSIEMALAAYNGGEGRALRVYRGSGGRNFWDSDVYAQFPPETQDYVPMVIAAAWLFLHPKQYGLEFPKVDARPATLRLAQPSSIYQLTICLGNTGEREGYLRALRNLNPRYEPDGYLAAGTSLNATARIVGLYNRWCQTGPRAQLAQQLVRSTVGAAIVRSAPVPSPVSTYVPGAGVSGAANGMQTTIATGRPGSPTPSREHRVDRGDTLYSVASRYECDLIALARANGLAGPRYAVRPGQRLKLEGCAR